METKDTKKFWSLEGEIEMLFHVIQISCNTSAAIQTFSGFTAFSSRKIN